MCCQSQRRVPHLTDTNLELLFLRIGCWLLPRASRSHVLQSNFPDIISRVWAQLVSMSFLRRFAPMLLNATAFCCDLDPCICCVYANYFHTSTNAGLSEAFLYSMISSAVRSATNHIPISYACICQCCLNPVVHSRDQQHSQTFTKCLQGDQYDTHLFSDIHLRTLPVYKLYLCAL